SRPTRSRVPSPDACSLRRCAKSDTAASADRAARVARRPPSPPPLAAQLAGAQALHHPPARGADESALSPPPPAQENTPYTLQPTRPRGASRHNRCVSRHIRCLLGLRNPPY